MLKKDFVICKARTELSEFIKPITHQLDRPRKKFLMQVIGAILLSGSLIVTEMARWVRDECSDRFYLKRLLNHLEQLLPDKIRYAEVIKVIDLTNTPARILGDIVSQQVLCFLP